MKSFNLLILLSIVAVSYLPSWAALPAQSYTDFNRYAAGVESRLASQHASPHSFISYDGDVTASIARLRQGEILITNLHPAQPAGAMLHHWRATAFAPGARAADFLAFMQDYLRWTEAYSPQVIATHLIGHQGDDYRISMRVREHHVITVVLDTDYQIHFGRLNERYGYSTAHSTRIAEIAHAGERGERALSDSEEEGYLARSNTYWSYIETPEGLYMQCESLTLTRDAPRGLGWAVKPFIESIPQQTLRFTMDATRKAMQTRRIHEHQR
jgi:hypothetical protein